MKKGILYDFSGTITTGGTSQTACAVDQTCSYVLIQNPFAEVETLFVNFGAAASLTAAGSINLAPGGNILFEGEFVPVNDIRVNAATTGHKFVIKKG